MMDTCLHIIKRMGMMRNLKIKDLSAGDKVLRDKAERYCEFPGDKETPGRESRTACVHVIKKEKQQQGGGMMENQKIKDLFAGERFGCDLGYYRITGSRSQRAHNESLNRLEYKLACLLKAEDAERKAKIIAQGRALEALKAERKDLISIISEVRQNQGGMMRNL